MSDHVIRWNDRVASPDSKGVTRTRLEGAGASLVRIGLPAGTKATEHSHDHEQFVEVLAGGGTLATSQGEREFSAGDVVHFPPGTSHSARFTIDTVLLEVNVASR